MTVDPFHVVQDANTRADAARLVEQDGSRCAIPRHPLLKPGESLTPKQATQSEWVTRKFPDLFELYPLLEKRLEFRFEEQLREELYLTPLTKFLA